MLTCPRCKREVNPWPIGNRSICSPKDWVRCIRNDLEPSLSVLPDTMNQGPREAHVTEKKRTSEAGASAVEYGLLIAAVAVVMIVAVRPLTTLIVREIFMGAPNCSTATHDEVCWDDHH